MGDLDLYEYAKKTKVNAKKFVFYVYLYSMITGALVTVCLYSLIVLNDSEIADKCYSIGILFVCLLIPFLILDNKVCKSRKECLENLEYMESYAKKEVDKGK